MGIPLLLKYEIPGKKISPSLAIGKNNSFVLNSKVDDIKEDIKDNKRLLEQLVAK